MLYGRGAECGLLEDLLHRVRQGHGDALVLRGEAGIGKTSLLRYAAKEATGFTVLELRGVEAESGMPYAGLHGLLHPVRERVSGLSASQRHALEAAMGLEDCSSPSRFLVAAAVVELLATLAEEHPVLCLVDDAQWVDPASLGCLTFAQRRLGGDRVALVVAVRTDGALERGAGARLVDDLPSVPVARLDEASVDRLLDERADLDPVGRAAVAAAAHGNPLALLALSPGATGGGLADRPSLGTHLHAEYLSRTAELPGTTRHLLLVTAVHDTGELPVLLAAAAQGGATDADLTTAERHGLLEVSGATVQFTHPLVRSAVHDGATSAERRAAHGALATALADVDPASSTWHRASAVLPPDEGLAARLADLAGGAVRRADPGLAAVAFRRAADFTGDPRARLCWLLAAGQAAWDAGRVTEARSLVAAAGAAATADEDVARVQELRGRLEALTGSAARGFETLLPAAESVLAAAPDRAARMLYTALQAASVAGDMRRVEQAGRVAGRLAGGADPEPVAVVAAALADLVTKQRVRDGIALAEATRALARTDDLDGLTTAAVAAVFSGDYPLGEELASRAVARCRDVGAVGTLARALEPLVVARLSRAPRQAEADADEGLRAARETDQVASAATHLGSMAVVAALRGDRQRTEQLAGEALGLDRLHGVAYPAAMVQAALGLLELGLGRPTEALAHLEPLHEHEGHPAVRLLAADFTVLAAVWSGRPELAHAVLTTVGSWPWVRETASRAWAETTLNRWRGLLGDGAEATACFERAVAGEAATGQPLGLAVTHLLLGEHLRRSRQRAAARPHLRAALELFERLDACRGRPGRAPSSEPPVRACEVTATTSPV